VLGRKGADRLSCEDQTLSYKCVGSGAVNGKGSGSGRYLVVTERSKCEDKEVQTELGAGRF
jgi:hypothetical protein